ncbi:hypothetical protein MABM_00050 [Mycobacteroides abscessus]|uniref:amino acid-binding protein n=1 Tax=Mycobacteroides abscessus TaxID=36809 RepID=UPI00138CEBE4|nr:amino acid-binding protein [Mycobacteroides abscessus]BBZ80089.1 hypothetical protein MABM_00050 [Mycobacteroides abscessus]
MLDVPSYLLRLQLADRPGSLGSVAVALGTVGADILSLDVVERGPGYAIDDLVIDLPPGSMPDSLITAAEALNGVHVHSIRPPHTGWAHRELELIDRVAPPRRPRLEVLAQEAPCAARWCTVVRQDGTGFIRVAGRGRPETQATSAPWLPLSRAQALETTAEWVPQLWKDMDTTLAAAPLGSGDTAVVLGRPGGPEFRPSEVARLGYLAGIVATLVR